MNKRQKQQPGLGLVISMTSFMALIGVGLAVAAYIRRYILHEIPMTSALSGELHDCFTRAGRVAYYASDPDKRSTRLIHLQPAHAMLLIHGVHAAASSYELKPIYEYYARTRNVYSLELPGFGFSERANRAYSPNLYRDTILEFITNELKGAAVDAVASSLSCEFLALAATEKPELFRTLTFLSPTGMSASAMRRRGNDLVLRFLLAPSWSRMIYDLLTSRPSIQYFSGLTQMRGHVRGLDHYAYVTSHQPNAQYAPFYFLAGYLFTPGILRVYRELRQPVLMLYGQSRYNRYDQVDELRGRTNWRISKFARARDLVQYDNTTGVIAEMDQFLAQR